MKAFLHTLQLHEPFRIAHGTSASRQVLRIEQKGHIAEAPFVPYYGEDPAETLRIVTAPVLPEKLPQTAALAFNLLRHDIVCTAQNQPLSSVAAKKLGCAGNVPAGCRSLGIPTDLGDFADKVSSLAEQFRVLKLKLGSGDLGLDIATVSVARMAAPDAQLMIDVNGGWDPVQAVAMIEKLAEYEPALIEQPIHHRHGIEAWEDLRANLRGNAPAIFADESVQNAADVEALAPYVDGVNVKLLKSGSFDGAVAMISAARKENVQVLLGCMIESSLGVTAAAHLAPWADWIDLDGHFYVANDDFDGLRYENGALILPERAGIGAIQR
jgi:L-alanine-DL-glutamate epimerase-like enolase superfamily enzyme